jgi:hypothetical protein
VAAGNRPRSYWIGSALAWVVLFSGRAEAATQGESGATSTGNISIGVSIAPSMQTNRLSDVALGGVGPAVTATSVQNVCVWSNTPTRGYSITASGSGPESSFVLANGSRAAAYSVAWARSPGETSGTSLNPDTALAKLTSAAAAASCTSGQATTASLIVTVALARHRLTQASYSGALSAQSMSNESAYTGALTLIVSPE